MLKHKLMIKTHTVTGLKYLCYTRSEGLLYSNYKGSGVLWKKHLKKYGDNIKTELLYESDCFDEFKNVAIQKSIEYDIVTSDNWANLKIEEGDGGNTVSNKFWITNGITDKYLNKDLPVPEGWQKGRTNCVFNDSDTQRNLVKRQSKEYRSEIMQKCWQTGKMDKRDNSKCGVKGDNNPAKRIEIKEKIRQAALSQSLIRSERMKNNKVWIYSNGRKNKNI